jgi:hypothetical protein
MRGLIGMAGETELSIGQESRNGFGIMASVTGDVRILGLIMRVCQLCLAVTFPAGSSGCMMRIVARDAGSSFLAYASHRVRSVTLTALKTGVVRMIEARRPLAWCTAADPDRHGDFHGSIDFHRRMTPGAPSSVGDGPVMAGVAAGGNSE